MTETNGRVTTRDLLAAVEAGTAATEASEQRITHRIDRLESSVDESQHQTDSRLAVIEIERAEHKAGSAGKWSVITAGKTALLAFIATVSGIAGALAAGGYIG